MVCTTMREALSKIKDYAPLLVIAGGLLGYVIQVEARVARTEAESAHIEAYLDRLEHRLERLENKIDRISNDLAPRYRY